MDKQWEAKWIMDATFGELRPVDVFQKELESVKHAEPKRELQNRHMLARKEFTLEGGIRSAILDITADDYYKLYVNGRFVGQGPAQANYFHYYYNQFDLASYLVEGSNVIAVHVYYHGLISRSYNSGDNRQGLIAELTVNGKVAERTDRTWKYRLSEEYRSGGTTGYNTQFLENIDQRLKINGWRDREFDDTDWNPAWEHWADDHRLFLQPTPPLSVYEVKPERIHALTDEGYLIDFGHEITGQFRMKAKGKPGQVIEIRCGEELWENGRVREEMRCNCVYREHWTLSGLDDEFELFDYKAFRYVEVLAVQEIFIDTGSFSATVRHYPLDEQACLFDSSDPMLNAIWSICKNGVKYGSQENYVDCPSREKGQYLGDNTIITHAHAYLSGDLRLFRKSLLDFALLSSRVCPGMVAVAPGHHMQEIADFSFQWPMQLLQYYMQSGDKAFLEEMYPVAERMMRYFDKYRREDGLLANVADKWNLVDWPEGMRDGYDFPLKRVPGEGCHNVINAFYYGAMLAVAEIRRHLHLPESGDLASFREAFCRTFYRSDTKLFADAEHSSHASLHANALPLLFGLVPDEARKSVVELIRAKRLSCGVYMAYFVLNALAAADEHDLAYELLSSEDLHSWGNMVKEGATTCFEAWSKSLKWNTSLCHPWASAPIPYMIEHVIGLKPAAPGWTKVNFSPRLPASLQSVKLSFRVAAGNITFSYQDGRMQLTLPEGVHVVEDGAEHGSL
ncbi:family 78 glycoside hydrolase catalytic domain [Paenibacillus allorhizosphaerae]|uniref:Alpha-L-rhamnosidase n=1 Tax=Paenibacillus allorhizosphaerae TaxID=2849866 RepID=A0ABM8VA61_9BACL|nr:family 78 glycoside hydrolase catalytic domain [Paenibacillus allorhizosphaerae]CAG7614778.1 hypothetical protein PAECIP111802_00108 [Paenibacillus allorhizosphaerae]